MTRRTIDGETRVRGGPPESQSGELNRDSRESRPPPGREKRAPRACGAGGPLPTRVGARRGSYLSRVIGSDAEIVGRRWVGLDAGRGDRNLAIADSDTPSLRGGTPRVPRLSRLRSDRKRISAHNELTPVANSRPSARPILHASSGRLTGQSLSHGPPWPCVWIVEADLAYEGFRPKTVFCPTSDISGQKPSGTIDSGAIHLLPHRPEGNTSNTLPS